MKLITEVNFNDVQYVIEEGATGKKNLYIEGIFLQSAVKNKNGRIYPEAVMDREVDRYSKSYVTEGRAYGELGHPQGPQINLHLASHRIVELRKSGTDYIGKAIILPEGNGRIVQGMIETGGKLGVSSRGLGTIKENKDGIKEVQDDFILATAADIVHDPSAPNAFVNGIMEGVEFYRTPTGAWEVQERVEDMVKEMRKLTVTEINERKVALFERWLKAVTR